MKKQFPATAWLFCFLPLCVGALNAAEEYALHTFQRIQLHDQFWSEGANFGDLNKDGVNDLVAGPWWWEGPDFKKRHEYYPSKTTFNLKLSPLTSAKFLVLKAPWERRTPTPIIFLHGFMILMATNGMIF